MQVSIHRNNNNTHTRQKHTSTNIMLVSKAAILLSAAWTTLPGVHVQAQEYEVSPDGTIIGPPDTISGVDVDPIEYNSDSRITAYGAEGSAELEAHVAEEEEKNGWSISMGKARTSSKPHKAGGRGAGGRGGRAAGGGGGGNNGRGDSFGGGRVKGKGRYLQEDDDIATALGFAVIETTLDFTEEEYVKLENMPGVALVESDVEVYIDDESLLRGGGPREKVRSIMESMVMEMVRVICFIDILCMMCMHFVLCIIYHVLMLQNLNWSDFLSPQ